MNHPTLTKNFIAEGAVAARRFIVHGSADGQVAQASGVSGAIVGVSDELGAADTERLDAHLAGVPEVEYGATITRGQRLTADADGKAIPAVEQTAQAVVAGGAAGDFTVTGLLTTDTLVSVQLFAGAGTDVTDIANLTAEFSITAAATISNTGGTASTSGKLLVTYQRVPRIAGQAMVSGVAGDIGAVLLGAH